MVNTCHEKIYKERGIKFYGEFYSDLEYDETGYLVIAKGRNKYYPTDRAVEVHEGNQRKKLLLSKVTM